jgi:hypothetical protein
MSGYADDNDNDDNVLPTSSSYGHCLWHSNLKINTGKIASAGTSATAGSAKLTKKNNRSNNYDDDDDSVKSEDSEMSDNITNIEDPVWQLYQDVIEKTKINIEYDPNILCYSNFSNFYKWLLDNNSDLHYYCCPKE